MNPDFYATSSALASGKWARVQVKESGMQFISNSTLKTLGFSDPGKVNVYGCGGRVLAERLDANMSDDLPVVPCVRTAAGIVFFGHSTTGWAYSPSGVMTYTHTYNPYTEVSYYFISDNEVEAPEVAPAAALTSGGTTLTSFRERLLHEQDLLAPHTSGRLLLGEDFRTQTNRNFNFNLPGCVSDAAVRMVFGAKVTNGSSSLMFTANGEQLPSTDSDKIPSVSSESFLSVRSTVKRIENPTEKLNFGIRYSYSGAIFTAALDYIEVEYERRLSLEKNELYFYLNPAQASEVELTGCTENTRVWDITNPLRPTEYKLTLSGMKGTFVAPSGYHEFIAFDPLKVSRSLTGAGKVQNQDLHAMKAPDMLIVAPDQYLAQARKIADLHAQVDGMEVAVVTPQQVYNEFSSGNPDLTAFRKLLKMWYDRAPQNGGDYTRFCLLMSRPSYDNKMVTAQAKKAGYPRIPIWQSENAYTESRSYSTDDYIGMLDDQPGALNMGSAKIHVAVGRMPVKNVSEAETAVAKLEKYLLQPNPGYWRNNVMVIADDEDHGVHLTQAEKVINAMRGSSDGASLIYEKLYLDAYQRHQSGSGVTYPEAKKRMMDKINEGVALIDYIGHASPRGWGHENLLTWTDINSFTNTNLPFIYAATCEFMYWDADDVSGAEVMWLEPEHGVIGMICPSRKVYITQNGDLNESTSRHYFSYDKDGKPLRLGEIMINGKNARTSDDNKLRYGFMGDPALRLPFASYHAVLDSINGSAVSDDDLPELKARSKVTLSGTITDIAGNVADDFNGTLAMQLFDAEKVIETYGNGKDGDVMTYNDRKTRLLSGNTKVSDGRWSATFVLPSEIENNYSPALLSLYANDEAGREANGHSEQFYVYGFESNPQEDFDGPVITGFYLNSPQFTDGTIVSPSPMLYATLTDPSGINLSEAGIGHAMVISVDGKEWLNDVSTYFTADPESFEKGTLAYPLKDLAPGRHELTFTVWDNANNSSSATLSCLVKADWSPSISTLKTDVNPATTSVTFCVEVDGALGTMPCMIEVFDLGGKSVWSTECQRLSSGVTEVTQRWDLRDHNGHRVPRGIYIYRATVTGADGREIRKSNKLAVTL